MKYQTQCDKCNSEITENSNYCSNCGKEISKIKESSTAKLSSQKIGNKIIYAIIVVTCINIFFKVFADFQENEKTVAKDSPNYADSIAIFKKKALESKALLKQIENSELKKSRPTSQSRIEHDPLYFYSINHPKAKGMNFKIKKPGEGFEQLEGNRPSIVQKWEKDRYDNSKYVSILLIVKNLDADLSTITKSHWINYLKTPEAKIFMTKDLDNVNNYKFIMIDNYPGIYFEYNITQQSLNEPITVYSASINMYVDGKVVSLQLLSPNKESMYANVLEFNKLATTLVFLEQYN